MVLVRRVQVLRPPRMDRIGSVVRPSFLPACNVVCVGVARRFLSAVSVAFYLFILFYLLCPFGDRFERWAIR